jgi:hypothetical protein
MKLTVLPHPAKPLYGTPCNGCGQCCMGQLCPPAQDIWPGRKGPCPALEYEGDRFWCGIIRHPTAYLQKEPDPEADKLIGPYFASSIGTNWGCDAMSTPEDRRALYDMAFEVDPERRKYARFVITNILLRRI